MSLYEGQILQMLADMKEQMEQQARSNRDREQAAPDREDTVCEQGALRQLNDQLHVQIDALQST